MPESQTVAKRRTPPDLAMPPPAQFIFQVVQGLIHQEGLAGLSSAAAIQVLSNPANGIRWYAAYVACVENIHRFISGELDPEPVIRQLPEAIQPTARRLAGLD